MKTYTFIYADNNDNELQRKEFDCFNDKEAEQLCQKLFAETMLNDCTKVYFIN
jgi:hypothetical protein